MALGYSKILGELNRCVRRLFDIIAATAGLALLSPLFLIVCVAIKLDSRGPIFLRQVRFGYKNRAIDVLTFRSVTSDTEANKGITRVGRIVRRSGIDRLPQLFNVLHGDMSIVGPRPCADRDGLLKNELMQLIKDVKPGMTGLAQIAETRGRLRTREQLIKDDLFYVENKSLFLDIKIILNTFLLFPKPNASTDDRSSRD